MIYQKENEVIAIIQVALQYKHDLLIMKNYINAELIRGGHPYACSSGLTIMLTEEGSSQFSYYVVSDNKNYDNISGIMSI